MVIRNLTRGYISASTPMTEISMAQHWLEDAGEFVQKEHRDQLERAKQRISKGSFNVCERCGKAILRSACDTVHQTLCLRCQTKSIGAGNEPEPSSSEPGVANEDHQRVQALAWKFVKREFEDPDFSVKHALEMNFEPLWQVFRALRQCRSQLHSGTGDCERCDEVLEVLDGCAYDGKEGVWSTPKFKKKLVARGIQPR